jgi:hypothetical protein
MKLAAFAVLSVLASSTGVALSQTPSLDSETSNESATCLAKRTDESFLGFEAKREEWAAQYQRRKVEFRPRMLSHADDISKCIERALRRDLAVNARTTFGIEVDPDGRVVKVAVLASNHANNLYGNCLARILCRVELTKLNTTRPEILALNIDLRGKVPANQRPWSLEALR